MYENITSITKVTPLGMYRLYPKTNQIWKWNETTNEWIYKTLLYTDPEETGRSETFEEAIESIEDIEYRLDEIFN